MTSPKIFEPISFIGFAYVLANYRLAFKSDKIDRQSAARIKMTTHHISEPSETLPCSKDFHDTLRCFSF